MASESILMSEVIGKRITDICCKYGKQDDWLDTAECFIQLDHAFYIEIPYGYVNNLSIVTPGAGAKTIFENLSDHATYYINKEGKTVGEVWRHKKNGNVTFFIRSGRRCLGTTPYQKNMPPTK
jgi:hypothetical protein